MKIRTKPNMQPKQYSPDKSETSLNCTCQVLLDTSLSGVSDSDCSCSDCLQANLDAFNELDHTSTVHQQNKHLQNRYKSSSNLHKSNYQKTTKQYHKGSRSQQKIAPKKTNAKFYREQNREYDTYHNKSNLTNQLEQNKFSKEGIDEYVQITKYRTRKYLEEKSKLKKQQIKEKESLKQKIKQNLQYLKYTTKNLLPKKQDPKEDAVVKHDYKWNHKAYQCTCNEQQKCLKRKKSYVPDPKKQQLQIIQERIRKRKEQLNNKPPYQCPDKCPNHHMRTDKRKIKEINQFIKNKVKQYKKKQKKQAQDNQQRQKAKEAKLRAIDIKCKQLAAKSKKYDDDVSRTSFQLSVDQFSTFSEARQFNNMRVQQKQHKRKIKKEIKKGGGRLQKAIYEDLDEQIDDYKPGIESKVNQKNKKQVFTEQQEQEQEWNEKIVKDARIRAPKNIKEKDKEHVIYKQTKNNKKKQGIKQSDLQKAEKKKKEIEDQITRKRLEIMNQYKKRNIYSEQQPKNKQMRIDYEENRKGTKQYKPQKQSKEGKDHYRAVYKTQAGKDMGQLNAHGDPLMQEFGYHKKQKEVSSVSQKQKEVFTSNVYALKSKQKLAM